MASPREIQDNHDRSEVMAALERDKADPPHGFIRVNGKMMGVWLAEGVDPKAIGLKTWNPTRRWRP